MVGQIVCVINENPTRNLNKWLPGKCAFLFTAILTPLHLGLFFFSPATHTFFSWPSGHCLRGPGSVAMLCLNGPFSIFVTAPSHCQGGGTQDKKTVTVLACNLRGRDLLGHELEMPDFTGNSVISQLSRPILKPFCCCWFFCLCSACRPLQRHSVV